MANIQNALFYGRFNEVRHGEAAAVAVARDGFVHISIEVGANVFTLEAHRLSHGRSIARAVDAFPCDRGVIDDPLCNLSARSARAVLICKRGPFCHAEPLSERLGAHLLYVFREVHCPLNNTVRVP